MREDRSVTIARRAHEARGTVHVLVYDVGGTAIKVALVGADGDFAWRTSVPTPHGAQALTALIARLDARIMALWDLDPRGSEESFASSDGELDVQSTRELVEWRRARPRAELLPIRGVAVPGLVDERAGRAVHSVNLGWTNVPMKEELEAALRVPVLLCHDIRSGALGHAAFTADAPRTYLFLALGTGLACALVIDGRIVAPSPLAGEIGQLPTWDPLCERLVSLENVCSARAFGRRFAHLAVPLAGADPAGALAAEITGIGESTRAVFALARTPRGELARELHELHELANEVIDTGFAALGRAVSTVAALLGPVPILVGGGLVNEGEYVRECLARHLDTGLDTIAGELPGLDRARDMVELAAGGSWAQCRGIARQVFDALPVADGGAKEEESACGRSTR